MNKYNSKLDQISKTKRIANTHNIKSRTQRTNLHENNFNRKIRIPTRREKRNMREMNF
jgi:hypothetical protein